MMIKNICFIFSVIVFGFNISYAESIEVKMGDNVSKYMNNLSEGNASHRSGKTEKDYKNSNVFFDYFVENDDPSIINKINKSKQSDEWDIVNNNGVITIKNKKLSAVKALRQEMSIEKYLESLDVFFGNIDVFKNNYEYELHGIEKDMCMNCDDKSTKVTKIYVNLRRIFEGRVVRGNLSYIMAKLTPDGIIEEIEIKWPKFEITDSSQEEVPLLSSIQAINIFGTPSDKVNCASSGKIKQIGSEIKGMARAWIPTIVNGKTFITPGFSFFAEKSYEDGTKKKALIDIPQKELALTKE